MQAPVTVLQANTKRDVGKKAQSGNIMAAKVLAGCWLAVLPQGSFVIASARAGCL